MTKSDLIEALSVSRNLPRRTAEEVVGVLFDSMKEVLVDGGRVEIRGFGSFKVRHYKGYTGRNPKSGRPIEVGPKRLPVFKVSKSLRDRVNKGLC